MFYVKRLSVVLLLRSKEDDISIHSFIQHRSQGCSFVTSDILHRWFRETYTFSMAQRSETNKTHILDFTYDAEDTSTLTVLPTMFVSTLL